MKLSYIQYKANISSVLWMIAVGKGMSYYPKEFVYKGHSLGNSVWLGRKSKGYFFCGDETTKLRETIDFMKEELIKDPDHIIKVRQIFDNRIGEKKRFMETLENGNYSDMSDEELLKFYDEVVETYCYIYPYGEPIAFVTKDFAEFLKPKFKGTDEEFYVMISPREKSFLQIEEMDMLKIALSSKSDGINEAIKEQLRKHTEKYSWIPYDYGANHYNYEHFLKELEKLLKMDLGELQTKYASLKNYEDEISKKQKDIIKKYEITEDDQKLYSVVQICYYLVDAKKEYFTRIHWHAEKLFLELSRRLNIDIDYVRHSLPEEMKGFLTEDIKPSIDKFKERIENYYFYIKDDGSYDFKQGEEAEEIIDEFLKKYEKEDDEKHVTGRVAQKGRVAGRARIIMNALECHRIKHGDILITSMTSPDFMVAVKRASAIVTDEGGVTCHAAIISRELEIPCIIGTKNATKIFKDGDIIEVDSDKGIVRKIE